MISSSRSFKSEEKGDEEQKHTANEGGSIIKVESFLYRSVCMGREKEGVEFEC